MSANGTLVRSVSFRCLLRIDINPARINGVLFDQMSGIGQGCFVILLNFHLHGQLLLPLDTGMTAIPDLIEEASEVSVRTAALLLEEGRCLDQRDAVPAYLVWKTITLGNL